ncbi:MAG: DUF3857 domain-containing protein [Kofleriaceae bacterium]
MKFWRVVLVMGACGWVGGGPAHAAPSALDKPAFTATPGELLAAAKSATGDWPAFVLRHEDHVKIDERGRATRRWRLVFVVLGQAAVDDWGTLQTSWSPFYQKPPVIRARVIEPDGKVVELDPKVVTHAPQTSTSPSVFSDRRITQAPLPRLRIGAVVEEEIVSEDVQPLLEAGTVEQTVLGYGVPTASTRVSFDAPAARKATHVASGLPAGVQPKHELRGGRETWTYALGPLPPASEVEPFEPGDARARRSLAIATGGSWNRVARDYRKLVERRLAEGPFALPSGLPSTPSIEAVRAITAWVHHQVRYTGIEFGEASLVPWPPAETVKRGFGDCKDKATLLVALLRQVGIRADLALLFTGPGRDVDPRLPGMGGFDHAIVRARVGARDVWIDATEDLLLPGQLPSRDQGRLALVIADDATALIETPRAAPAENLVREVRTYQLSETGAATRVTEVSREGGVYAAQQRAWLRDTRTEEVRKGLETYVKEEYGAKLDRYSSTSPTDLSVPLAVTVDGTESMRAVTGRTSIEALLYARDALEKVPAFLRSVPEAGDPPRRSDFAWFTPHVYEIENRLVMPPGYTAPSLPAPHTRKLGTATLTETHRLDGNTLVVTFRFESGKPRLTPRELGELRQALHDIGAGEVRIAIDHTGRTLAERGKLREAVVEIERLIALHPREAVHHGELAFVLTEAGMGTAARRAARKGVAVEPTSADAHAVLGWVLTHDALGRQYGADHDRAGALAALAKARALDPKHVGAAIDHARTLQVGASGVLFGPGSDVRGAVAAWRAAFDLAPTNEHGQALAIALWRSGATGEAEQVARKLDRSEERDALLLATIAASRGARSAIDAAGTLRSGAERTNLLNAAGGMLLAFRDYEPMRELYAHTGLLRSGPTAPTFQKLRRYEPSAAAARDPRSAFIEATSTMFTRGTPPVWDAATAAELAPHLRSDHPGVKMLATVGTGVGRDIVAAIAELEVEGTDAAWRVRSEMMGQRVVAYVALDRGAAKLFAFSNTPEPFGRHVFRLLARNDLATAARCLDWLVKDEPNSRIAKVWGPSLPRDRAAISLSAALLARRSEAARAAPILEKCASSVAAARAACDAALEPSYTKAKRWKDLEAHARAWLQREPAAHAPVRARATALGGLGRFDEAERLLRELSARRPDDREVDWLRAYLELERGRLDEAIRHFEPVVRDRPSAIVFNQAAWIRAVEGKDLAAAAELARKAVGPNEDAARAPALNTLATIEAELGELGLARSHAWKAMEKRAQPELDSSDWYVVGRIAEQLGLIEDARAAYKKVAPEPGETEILNAHHLAQRRLKLLGGARR